MPDLYFLTTGAEFEVFCAGFFPGWGRAGIIGIVEESRTGEDGPATEEAPAEAQVARPWQDPSAPR